MKYLLIILTLCFTSLSFASDKLHTLTIQGHGGNISNTSSTEAFDDLTSTYATFAYQYNLSKNIYFGAHYYTGASSDFIFSDLFNDSKVEFTGFLVSAGYKLYLTKKAHLFAQVAGNYYNYDILENGSKRTDEDGTDFAYSLGYKYQFNNGIGMQVSLDKLNLGDIELETISYGISYSF